MPAYGMEFRKVKRFWKAKTCTRVGGTELIDIEIGQRVERSNSKKLRKPNRRRRYGKKERESRKKRKRGRPFNY